MIHINHQPRHETLTKQSRKSQHLFVSTTTKNGSQWRDIGHAEVSVVNPVGERLPSPTASSSLLSNLCRPTSKTNKIMIIMKYILSANL